MKLLKFTWLWAIVCVLISCSKDKPAEDSKNGLEGLLLTKTISNATHRIDIYTTTGKFQTGYNAAYFQVKNNDGSIVNNVDASWVPVMTMVSMSHSCPASAIVKKQNTSSVYESHIVFQMAGNETEYWELALNYKVNGTAYTAKDKITVTASSKRTSESFMGNDGKRYVLAMVLPDAPKVAVNEMSAVLYQMESMMQFKAVDNYKIKIDPRMPGMGNHSSPNNVDLTGIGSGHYKGSLSLTMTGYWKINLQVLDAANQLIKGEPVTTDNIGSSIYFELEF